MDVDRDEGEDEDEDEAWAAGSTGMKEKVGVVLDHNNSDRDGPAHGNVGRGPSRGHQGLLRTPSPSAIASVMPCNSLGGACFIQHFTSHSPSCLNAVGHNMAFLLAIRTYARQFLPAYGGEGCSTSARLIGLSIDDGILLLEAAENGIGIEGGGIHREVERGLEVFRVSPKCIQEEDDLDRVKVHRTHISNPGVHGENFLSPGAVRPIRTIIEVESLFEEDELGLWTKFLMVLLKLLVDEVRGQ